MDLTIFLTPSCLTIIFGQNQPANRPHLINRFFSFSLSLNLVYLLRMGESQLLLNKHLTEKNRLGARRWLVFSVMSHFNVIYGFITILNMNKQLICNKIRKGIGGSEEACIRLIDFLVTMFFF